MRSGVKLSSKNFFAPLSSSGMAASARVQTSLSASPTGLASRPDRCLVVVSTRQLARNVENAAA